MSCQSWILRSKESVRRWRSTSNAAVQFESSYGTLAAAAALEQRRKEALTGSSTEDMHALILKYR